MSSHIKAAAPKVKGRMSFKAVNQQKVGKPLNGNKRVNRRNDEEDEDSTDEGEEADGSEMEEEMDTDDEITASRLGKSKKTASELTCVEGVAYFGRILTYTILILFRKKASCHITIFVRCNASRFARQFR